MHLVTRSKKFLIYRRVNITIQAVFHIYETFHRKDGHVVKLPMDRGEGQHWNQAPGNFYSVPVKINFNPKAKIIHNVVSH